MRPIVTLLASLCFALVTALPAPPTDPLAVWRNLTDTSTVMLEPNTAYILPNVTTHPVITLDKLIIMGELSCGMDQSDIFLNASSIEIRGNGVFECGNPFMPFPGRLRVLFRPKNADTSIVIADNGKLQLHGRERNGYSYLLSDVKLGDNTVAVEESVDWMPGDEILLVQRIPNNTMSQTFTVTNVESRNFFSSGKSVSLNQTAAVSALKNMQDKFTVTLLTRAIQLYALDSSYHQSKGLTISSSSSNIMQLTNVEMRYLGASISAPGTNSTTNATLVYPIQWTNVSSNYNSFISRSTFFNSLSGCLETTCSTGIMYKENICATYQSDPYRNNACPDGRSDEAALMFSAFFK